MNALFYHKIMFRVFNMPMITSTFYCVILIRWHRFRIAHGLRVAPTEQGQRSKTSVEVSPLATGDYHLVE